MICATRLRAYDELVLFVRARHQRIDRHRHRLNRVHFEMCVLSHYSDTGLPMMWPVCGEYQLYTLLCGRCNLWAFRREWLRGARSDTNPTHIPPSVVAHRATTLTTFVAVSVRKIHLHPATVMAALQLI